jgi:nitrite reductase (NO-forming)
MIFTIAAVAVMGATLFGSTFTQTQIAGTTMDATNTDVDAMQMIRDMGGLELVMPQAFAQLACDSLPADRKVVTFSITGKSVELPIMGGKTFKAMTFNERVPGPTLRVTQGDVVQMTLTVPADEATPHGNDMHASQMTAVPSFGAVQPGTSKTYCYIAQVPGVFKYHCSGVDVAAMDQHVLSGMYGITIVDPIKGYKKLMIEKTKVEGGKVVVDRQFKSADALEFQLQYNQLYLTDEGNYDATKMFKHQTTQSVVNGMALGYVPNAGHNELIKGDPNKNIFVLQPWNSADLKQYQSQLLFVETGQHVRFFVENQGNEPVFWHIVGEIIDRVVQGNRVQAQGTETWLLGGSQNMIADVVFDKPGVYVVVNHDYAAIFTGAASIIVAGDPFGLNEQLGTNAKSYAELLGNPVDAVPPKGMNSIDHPKLNLHGLFTDDRAAKIAQARGIEM